MVAGPCTEHALFIERIENLTKSLDANTATSNRLLEKLDRVASENDRAAVEMAHMKATITELKAEIKGLETELRGAVKAAEADMKSGDADQWTEINKLRAKVYIGVGLALALSAAITLFAPLVGK